VLVELDAPRTAWNSVTLAQLTGTAPQSLVFTNVSGGFQDALQTNQLFAVAGEPAVLLGNAGMQYEITATVLSDLATKRDPVPQAVITQLQPIQGTVYASLSAFDTQLQTTLGANYAAYHEVVEQYAPIFSITLDGWRFRLSPTLWKVVADFPTLVVFKYAQASVVDLAPDLGSWSWIEAAGSDPKLARDRLIGILDTARQIVAAANGVPNDLDDFVRMINDPLWNGIIFLNANVPVTALPAELSALVAGIDANKFFAHHFAVQLTPIGVKDGVPSLGNSSISALIAYDDPVDLYYQGDLYDFKVLSLHALFRSSMLVNFSSRIELMTNGYFGELCDLQNSTHNNNLILEGSALRQPGGTLSYVFLQQGSNVFAMRSYVLQSVEIVRAQFVTSIPPQGSTPAATTHAQFLLWGNLRWQQLPFDLFSFGPVLAQEAVPLQDGWLPFAGLSIDMEAQGTENGSKTLTFNPGAITLTPASAVARAQSLYAHFPLVLTGLIAGPAGKLPADLGYTALTIPGGSGALGPEWYGLVFDLDLGTLGALAGDLGFGISMLAAWAPGGTVANVQAAMLLPGGQGLTSLIPIQSVITLGFSSAGFTASEQGNGTMYMLAFRRFVLELLGVSFPPGQSDLVFFTNPNNSDRSTLGWYAAYSKD
jgi:hypothetical protein